MSRKHGRLKKQKNKLQQLDYLSEDNTIIDYNPSPHNDSYPPPAPINLHPYHPKQYRLKPKHKINFYLQSKHIH